MSDLVLDIKALTRRFGGFTAVDAISLSVNAGEVCGLLGSNGAGKTTTIKMLTTLLPPIGYVPQAVSVDGSLTGCENLLIVAILQRKRNLEAAALRQLLPEVRQELHPSAKASSRRCASQPAGSGVSEFGLSPALCKAVWQ